MAKKTKARRWRMRLSEGWLYVLVNPAGNDMVRSNQARVIKRLRTLCNVAEAARKKKRVKK